MTNTSFKNAYVITIEACILCLETIGEDLWRLKKVYVVKVYCHVVSSVQ